MSQEEGTFKTTTAARDQSFFLRFLPENPFAAQRVVAQRVIDGRIAQQGRHQHGDEARYEHRQQHRCVGGHLSNEHNAGQRGTPGGLFAPMLARRRELAIVLIEILRMEDVE